MKFTSRTTMMMKVMATTTMTMTTRRIGRCLFRGKPRQASFFEEEEKGRMLVLPCAVS